MQTFSIAAEPYQADFLRELQTELRTQDDAFTKTPLYCVYEQENEDAPQDGAGWPTSIFLTEKAAERFIKAVHYRLRNPYVYVRSPGEDSELHDLHTCLKEIEVGNGPFVEPEEET